MPDPFRGICPQTSKTSQSRTTFDTHCYHPASNSITNDQRSQENAFKAKERQYPFKSHKISLLESYNTIFCYKNHLSRTSLSKEIKDCAGFHVSGHRYTNQAIQLEMREHSYPSIYSKSIYSKIWVKNFRSGPKWKAEVILQRLGPVTYRMSRKERFTKYRLSSKKNYRRNYRAFLSFPPPSSSPT